MEVADRDAVFGGAAQRAEMDGADVDGGAEGVEGFLGFGVERLGVGGEGDSSLPVVESVSVGGGLRSGRIEGQRTLQV